MNTNLEWNDVLWSNPPSIYRSSPFWSWNEKLLPDRLCRQIDDMNQAGMGGFFMHSRYGLKTPYLSPEWFEAISTCLEKARKMGMKAYLYDEDRWPSGTAGGMVTRNHPEFALHAVVALPAEEASPEMERLATFAVEFGAEKVMSSWRVLDAAPGDLKASEQAVAFVVLPSKSTPWYNEAPYLDVMNAEGVAEFLRVTYQAYADRYAKDFGGLIPGIFTDEPNYYPNLDWQALGKEPSWWLSLPWTAQLPRQFKKRRGYDLRDNLPEIFFARDDSEFSKVRHDYYRTVTELYVENFSQQIGQWCERHNIAFTGHYLMENSFWEQVQVIGSAMPHYEHQQWPGIDMLTDQRLEISTVKQCSSVASQMAHERVLSEMYGCTGWDWPLEGHKHNAGWQFVLGVNFRCPHLSWYSMAGGGKRDYPASIFPHSPWWKYYRTVEDYFARLSLMLTQGRPVRDVLVIHTIESAWGTALPKQEKETTNPLFTPYNDVLALLADQHYDFDLGDESLLAKYGKVSHGQLSVNKMKYSVVVVPACLTLRESTVTLLRRFIDNGGSVLFVGKLPTRVDGEPSAELTQLTEQATCCAAQKDVVTATLEDLLPRRVSITQDGKECEAMWYMLRQVKGQGGAKQSGQLLFVQSSDRAASRKVSVSVQGRRPAVLWDTTSGKRHRLEARTTGDHVEFELELPASGSALVSLGLPVRDAEPVAKPMQVVASLVAQGPWEIQLDEPNVLPLDFCQYRIEDGGHSEPVPVLQAEELIRTHYGLPPRRNTGCQPWYLAQTGRWDRAARGRCEMRHTFDISAMPSKLQLAVERPEDYEFVLNGQTVSNQPVGWWVDEDIKVLDLRQAAKQGANELVLKFTYRSDMEIEDLHLLGDFGIARTGPKPLPNTYTLVAGPRELSAGSWVGQGLDFYGSSIRYRLKLDASVWSAISAGRRVCLSLPQIKCTCAAVHVGKQVFVLPWAPMSADITAALLGQDVSQCEYIEVEVVGGRHNSFGPLHVPWQAWTGPGEFRTDNPKWTNEYLLNDHGLTGSPVIELME